MEVKSLRVGSYWRNTLINPYIVTQPPTRWVIPYLIIQITTVQIINTLTSILMVIIVAYMF